MSAALAISPAAAPTVATLRTDLAAAVAKHAAAETAATKLTHAARDADSAVIDAFSAVERAEQTATKAGTIDDDELAASMLAGEPARGTGSRREARSAVDDAADRLTEAQAIRDALGRKAEEAKTTLGYASDRVRTAALALVKATSADNLAAFIAETERLQRDLQDRLTAIGWLRRERLVPYLDPAISSILAFKMVNDPGVPTRLDPGTTAGKWEAVIATLARDPKAPAVVA